MAQTRFAYSPMIELVTSYKLLTRNSVDVRYRQWADEARRSLYGIELTYLSALVTSCPYIPDFLTPTPLVNGLTFEDEIEQIMRTPEAIVRKNTLMLMDYAGESEILHQFLTHPREMLYCLADELRLYWERTLARHVPRIKAVLEEDILYHARKLALEGYAQLFEGLSPSLIYHFGEIRFGKKDKPPDKYVDLNGSGLELVPAIFSASEVMWQIVPEWHPMLVYSPRGTGLWWREVPQEPNHSLEIALGAGRARVLQGLMTPASTGELARRLNLSDGAVSQHLNRLRQAGLVDSQRRAKKVYYYLTIRGSHLLHLFDGQYSIE